MLRLVRKPKQISRLVLSLNRTDLKKPPFRFWVLSFYFHYEIIQNSFNGEFPGVDRFPFLSGNGEPLASDDQPSERQQPNEYATRRIGRLFRRFLLHMHIWCCHCSKNSIVLYVFSADPILLLLVSVIAYQVEKLSQVSGMKKLSQVSGRNTRSSVR